MQYKTITLALLQQRPKLHNALRTRRTLMQTLDSYASALKERHVYWMSNLGQAQPQREPSQIASEALELALQNSRTLCQPSRGRTPTRRSRSPSTR